MCHEAEPSADGAKREVVGPLAERAGPQRERLVEAVTEAGIDVPHAGRMVIGWQAADREHEVVGHHRGFGPSGPCTPPTWRVTWYPNAVQQLAERAVEVEAVATSSLAGDAFHRLVGVRAPWLAEVQPHRLVRHPLDLGAMEAPQGVD